MPFELAKGIYWVGVVDWGLRLFHGHELSTHRGSSYNSYLIVDEKTVLIDTAWTPFRDEFLNNVSQVIDPAKIDIVIAAHAEVDHSGNLPAVLRQCPGAKVIVSERGLDSIEGHHHQPWNFEAHKTGDKISIGKRELVFVEAPMLHWPDSLFTYVPGDNILFSNDAFGQHYASSARFNDQVDQAELFEEALKYYANILTPYSPMVTRKINEVLALNLPVDLICPSHGILWRKDPLQIVKQYLEWAAQTPESSAVIIYDTMWEGTRKMAEAIGAGLDAEGVTFKIFNAAATDRNDLITEVFKTKAVVLGSPTFNNGILPSIRPVMEDLRGMKFQNKIGAAFGTYGWSGEGVAILEEHLKACKFNLVTAGVKAKWQPKAESLAQCKELGQRVAQAIKTGP